MNANGSVGQTNKKPDVTRGILKRLVQVVVTLLIEAMILFGASGRLDWVMAWALIGVNICGIMANSAILLRKDPELVAERGEIGEGVKGWDRPLAGIISFLRSVGMLLVAGLDKRYGWSPQLPPTTEIIALLLVVLGYGMWGWAMASNRFFAGLVRIQKERGHTVATGGPYRYVRHPGYAGFIVFTLATPLVLSSLWALIPTGLVVCGMIVRTVLEDRTLQEELDGYRAYARRVRYRLLPGVW